MLFIQTTNLRYMFRYVLPMTVFSPKKKITVNFVSGNRAKNVNFFFLINPSNGKWLHLTKSKSLHSDGVPFYLGEVCLSEKTTRETNVSSFFLFFSDKTAKIDLFLFVADLYSMFSTSNDVRKV